MLIDATLVLSDAQELTTSTASDNTIDQLAAGSAQGHAAIVAQANEDFAGVSNLRIALQSDDDADFGSPIELLSVTLSLAELKKGKSLFKAVLPLGIKRYIRAYYTVTGSASAGRISLFITDQGGL